MNRKKEWSNIEGAKGINRALFLLLILLACGEYMIAVEGVSNSLYTNESPPDKLLELNVLSFVPSPDGGGALSGEIRNNGAESILDVQVEGIFYGYGSHIVDIRKSYPLGALHPGESKSFKIYTKQMYENIEGYDLIPHGDSEELLKLNIERELFWRINNLRAENGLNRLEWSSGLSYAADDFLEYMIENDFFCHVSPDGRVSIESYSTSYNITESVAENLATLYNYNIVVDAWMESPAHRLNLLYPGHNQGAVVIKKAYEGRYKGNYFIAFEAIGEGVWDKSVYAEGLKKGLSCKEIAESIDLSEIQ